MDAAGGVVFKMDGHALSIRDRCTLRDADGRAILSARKKVGRSIGLFKIFFYLYFLTNPEFFCVFKIPILKSHRFIMELLNDLLKLSMNMNIIIWFADDYAFRIFGWMIC